MQRPEGNTDRKTLLVFNCHEPWVYQLGILGYDLDIIIGLRGRYKETWDEQMRPVPANSRLITLPEALHSQTCYYCIIAHNISDLLDIRERPEPRLIVLHSTLEGRIEEEGSNIAPEEMKETLRQYLELVGGHAVAISPLKSRSWGFVKDVVHFGIEADDYPPYSGREACGIRICNFIENRKKILLWDLYAKAFDGMPVRIVGHNPGMPGVAAAESWAHLKTMLQSHRFYIHTADPRLEDGYNMAVGEAMAAGLPIVGNRHPTSPVKHGVSGFLTDNPDELRKYSMMLLEDRRLAQLMGEQARKTVVERFPTSKFKRGFLRCIETARMKRQSRKT
ncbi:MAG: glycosyltransferase [Planctomycetota bacterium]|jgi:hypothetical protein